MKEQSLQTVVETPEFIKQSTSCMDSEVIENFINFIAKNPTDGEIISGTHGVRKIRWASNVNEGKRGGVRIIYYYHNQGMPIFLFTVYKKNQKDNLTMSEKNILGKIVRQIVTTYEGDYE
jgi:mRNA-degrading endonuclease RelE of RelBE toxin-antitoxin system